MGVKETDYNNNNKNQKNLMLERESTMEKDKSGNEDMKGHGNLMGVVKEALREKVMFEQRLKEAKEQST